MLSREFREDLRRRWPITEDHSGELLHVDVVIATVTTLLSRLAHRPNEKEVSYRHRERAMLEAKMF
jgi:hypothetical protein